ncbi:NACHT, LRR and PYD domains-containing protein 12-like [Ciona intestinalis]
MTTTGGLELGCVQELHIHQHPEPAPIIVQPIGENLQSQLVDRSNQVIGESNMPIQLDRNIEAVRLEMSDVRQPIDDEWKEEMKRRDYLSSNRLNNSSVTIGQVFDKALEKAQLDAEVKCSTEAAKAEYIRRHANIVGVVGPPGVGKSTLSKMMVKHILELELLPDTEYLFFIYVKDINFDTQMTPLEFLITNSRISVNYNEEESKALIKWIHNNPNVVILFDGLDEASTKEFAMISHVCKLDGKSKPVDIMKNLFNFTLLPNAKIVVTSRPCPMYKLHPDYRPTSIFEVLGLLEEAKNNLGTQLCGEKYPAIKKILDQQPNLAHLCYLPINFILIVSCLLSNEGSEIKTMTQVLIFSMTRFVESSHLKAGDSQDKVGAEMVKLARLAYKGLQQRKLVFDKSDFDDVELADEMVTNFFHTYVDKSSGLRMKILEGNKRSYFTHLTWQEFYAAVYIMLAAVYIMRIPSSNNSNQCLKIHDGM